MPHLEHPTTLPIAILRIVNFAKISAIYRQDYIFSFSTTIIILIIQIIFQQREKKAKIGEVIAERDGDVGINVGVNVGVNSREISEVKLTERQTVMISVIKSNPMVTAKQMSETLSVTVRTIERDLALMQKSGIIRHEGSDKTGVWVILEK